MRLGYARVSAGEQNLAQQIDALRAAGADEIFEDTGVSGSTVFKPAYGDMLVSVRPSPCCVDRVSWRGSDR